jgi:hypothetical protein
MENRIQVFTTIVKKIFDMEGLDLSDLCLLENYICVNEKYLLELINERKSFLESMRERSQQSSLKNDGDGGSVKTRLSYGETYKSIFSSLKITQKPDTLFKTVLEKKIMDYIILKTLKLNINDCYLKSINYDYANINKGMENPEEVDLIILILCYIMEIKCNEICSIQLTNFNAETWHRFIRIFETKSFPNLFQIIIFDCFGIDSEKMMNAIKKTRSSSKSHYFMLKEVRINDLTQLFKNK